MEEANHESTDSDHSGAFGPVKLLSAAGRTLPAPRTSPGHSVRWLDISQLQSSIPYCIRLSQQIQPLEADLQQAQQDILWHSICLACPDLVGWSAGFTESALLTGYFCPALRSNTVKNSSFWDKLLSGRSAQPLLVTMDSPPWYYRWISGAPGHRQMQRTILISAAFSQSRSTASARRLSRTLQ